METEALFNQAAPCQYYSFPFNDHRQVYVSVSLYTHTATSLTQHTFKCTLCLFFHKEPKCSWCHTHIHLSATSSSHSALMPLMDFFPQNICSVTQASLSCVFTSNKAINHLNRPQLTPLHQMLAPHVIPVTARSVAHAVTSAKQVMNCYHKAISATG